MSHPAYKKPDRLLIVPFPVLLLLGGFFVGAAFLLIPKEEELLNRFIEDNNSVRAQDLAKTAKAPGVMEEAENYLKSMRDRLGGALQHHAAANPGINPVETLDTFLGDGTCRPGDVEFSDLVYAVRSAETPKSTELLEKFHLADVQENLPAEDWKTLKATVAEKALAEGKPSLAADLLLSACQGGEDLFQDWDRIRMAVQSCRWSDRTADAADLLSSFKSSDLPEEILELKIAVLQEIGDNEEAFSSVTEYIGALDDTALIPDKLMKSAEQAGLYSGHQIELLPFYRRHLAATRLGQMSWQDFLAAADSGELGDGSPYTRYAKTFARLCEWNNLQAESFENYRKLAVMGDWEATARCLSLYLGLARQMDMEEILSRLDLPASPEGREAKRLHLKLMGANGQYEKAVPAYRNWIAQNPDDGEACLELSLLLDEMGEVEQSLAACDDALAITPDKIELQVQRARLLQSLGRYEESLAILSGLSPEEHNATTREDYVLLSEAVGSWEDLNKALRMTIEATEKPKVEQFESLARSCELMGDTEGEIAALEYGLKTYPGSKTLALNLATTLVDQGKPETAVAVLSAPKLKDELAAVCLLIDIGGYPENAKLIYDQLGSTAHKRYNLPVSSQLALSEIYQLMGENQAAAEIYEDLPMGPPQWEMIASLRFNQQRFAEAKHYQELVTKDSTDHAAWMFLGEILQEMGDSSGAEVAFKKSLSLLRSRIVSESRSVAER